MHRRCLHEHRRCVTDVLPICRRCIWDIFNLGVPRRLLGVVRRCIADGIWRRNIGRAFQCMHWNFSRCPDALAKHGNYSRTSPIIRLSTGARWRCSGDAQIWASQEHRENQFAACSGCLIVNSAFRRLNKQIAIRDYKSDLLLALRSQKLRLLLKCWKGTSYNYVAVCGVQRVICSWV